MLRYTNLMISLGHCRNVDEYEKLDRIGEGAYGTVYRARDKSTDAIVALKRVILHNENSEGFPITAIREIKLLRRLSHPNCVQLIDVVVGRRRSSVFLVFEYCEHDFSALLRHPNLRLNGTVRHPFKESELKRIMLSVLQALEYLHTQKIVHRDVKLSNILYNRSGIVKLADFGLAREQITWKSTRAAESNHKLLEEDKLTPKVVTLWYRAPELLLGTEHYTSAVDMWACGCIFGELILQEPLMKGKTEMDQLHCIYRVLGRANMQIWPSMEELPLTKQIDFDSSRYMYNRLRERLPSLSERGIDLINKLLTYDPEGRISATDAIRHSYFREKPFPQESALMPSFPSLHHTNDRKAMARINSQYPNKQEKRRKY